MLSASSDKYYYNGLEEDLFQEGYIGLLLASEKYDKSLGIQFTTFAYKYIYGYCLNYLKKERISLNTDDIENSPNISNESYEMEYETEIDIIDEINKRLKIVNKKLSIQEEAILKDTMYRELNTVKCAEKNNCSRKKVTNTIDKYKDLIKSILIN